MSSTKKKPHRSVSQLTTYQACSEQWRLQRIAQAPQRPAAWFVQGSAVHEALEEYERSEREISEHDLHDVYLTRYRTEANDMVEKHPEESAWLTGGRKRGFDDLTEREERGWWQVQDYVSWAESESELWRVAQVELEFSIVLGGVEVIGFIDQITEWRDGTMNAADLKTGVKLPASPLQLVTYDHALTEYGYNTGHTGDWIHLGKPATSRVKEKRVSREIVDLTESPLFKRENLEQMYFDLDRGIENQVFLPNPSDSCVRTCGVSQFCRAMGHPGAAESRSQGLRDLQDSPWDN